VFGSSCSRGLGNATTFLTFLNCSRVVARPCTGSRRRPSVRRQTKPNCARTRSGAVRSSNPLLETRTRCGAVSCKSLVWPRKSDAQHVIGVVMSGRAGCAARFKLDSLRMCSWTLRRVCSRAATLPVLCSLTLCYACTVYDRRRLRLCFGTRIDEPARPDATARDSTSNGIARINWTHRMHRQTDVRPRIMSCSCGTAVATVGCLMLLWPLGPVEHGLFASGGDRALGVDSHSVWGG
jgi:hypothetical protein